MASLREESRSRRLAAKARIKKLSHLAVVLLLLLTVLFSSTLADDTYARASQPLGQHDLHAVLNEVMLEDDLSRFLQEQLGPFYYQVKQQWEAENIPTATQSFQVKAADYSAASNEDSLRVAHYDGRNDVLIWQNNREQWIELELDVPATGLYEMRASFTHWRDAEGEPVSFRPINMAFMINGEFPYREARSIRFPRFYHDDYPWKKDEDGHHIRPSPIEIERWIELPVTDREDSYHTPLLWYLEAGTQTLTIQGSSSIVLDQLSFGPPTTINSYVAVQQQYPSTASPDAEPIVIEAEAMSEKNEVSIQILSDNDAFMSPKADGKIIFNGVGGNRWNDGGEMITWEFEVEEDGLYQIGMRVLNNLQSNVTAHRKIYIDGQVPFEELLAYAIPYNRSWQKVVLQDEEQQPYGFYLTKGTHTLSMSVTYAPHKAVQVLLEQVNQELGVVSRDLQALTKGDDDRNRTWDIAQNFPEIPDNLRRTRDKISLMAELWLQENYARDNNYQSLLTSISDIDDLLDYPNDIPNKKDTLSLIQTKVASITNQLIKSPLTLDQIIIAPYEHKLPRMTANFWEKSLNGTMNFLRSFSEETTLSGADGEVLTVWMNYGRDYVNLLQELANQYFTPQTGIPVKIELLPSEDLLVLANATGNVPDVAIGIGEGRPSEFAFRNSAINLAEFAGFDELIQDMAPGAIMPYYYDGGYYALPETLQFRLLFYRKDILEHLDLEVPDTWDDVYEMLPTLQQNGYNFFLPNGEFLPFIYQNGADFYANDGINTGLDSPEGFAFFREITEMFTMYGIERQVSSFYQHFRDGYMPIGVADLNMYLQLLVAAPELTGWWGIAPLPGYPNAEGVVERWSGGNIGALAQGLAAFGGGFSSSGSGGQTAAMIMSKSQKPEEGWEFIRWWLSAQVQEQFGSELEGFYGAEFRWNTANLDAFMRLPWTEEEKIPILEQWRWYKAMVNVPGSYFIPRELNNAWNRTVIDGMNYRRSLEMAIMNINREMVRKQKEFGYRDENNRVIRTFNLPVVNEPWEGVERYVSD
ncbi:extracellular solute-binding protein [Paenibacillus senegalensis]|uniref:extracellular solute-binding protein n=1 Tax=Paenibacillus senegalensis TaxID=1465766 RepID=UPI0002898838|nr:extracellular solute-binding protein [Paenibacillus senegalensis]